MRPHRLVAVMACAWAATVQSQPTARGVRFDTAVVRTLTVDALLAAARAEVTLYRQVSPSPVLAAVVDSLLMRLDRPAVTRLPLRVVAESFAAPGAPPQASFGRVARFRRRAQAPGLGAGDAGALDSLTGFMPDIRRLVESARPGALEDSLDRILVPLDAMHFAQRVVSIGHSLEKLNRFERKYGPASPQLNAVEVGLNYLAQWVPMFSPTGEGWPSRLEIVSAYVPAYFTAAESRARAVTIAEIGVRSYIWRTGWGGAEGGVLRPGYVSFGVAVAGERDGVFASPLQGKSRVGAFFGWGQAKVAFIGGRDARVLVTRQFQAIPWVF